MNGGSTNLGIESLTTGVSREGLNQYLESVRMEILNSVCNEIDNVNGVVQAINNCWQGESRDRFLSAFAQIREAIKSDLALEHDNLENKLESLFTNMYYLDRFGIYENE